MRQALAQQQNPVALKNGKVLTKNNKGKTIPGISVNNKAISHGKNSTINVAIKKGNYRGVNIVKENGNYVAKWKLILKNGEEDTKVFSQVLCPIN